VVFRSSLRILAVIGLILGLLPTGSIHAVQADATGATGYTVIRVPQDVSTLEAAIQQIPSGGIIELAAGTYVPPSSQGYNLGNLAKGFTIRSAAGAAVTIDGQGSRELFRFQNKNMGNGRQITFENLVLANGRSTTEGTAGGITMYFARAAFVGVTFQNIAGQATTTVGGAAYVTENSVAFFFDCTFLNNSARFGGGALGIRSGAKVYIHRGRFTGNYSNPSGHARDASGGAINMGNAILRISNSRFDSNQAAAFGGALYVIGTWLEPYTTPRADLLVANSTFINNTTGPHPSSGLTITTEGGAADIEDQSLARFYHTRFITNRANIGGGINSYRSRIEVYDCVFLGNQATGSDYNSAFGGAITTNSLDTTVDGSHNRPAASMIIQDTYIQGRYGSVGTVAQTAGGIHSSGDFTRFDGDPAIPDMGGPEGNRATANVSRVVINDTDVAAVSPSNSGVGAGVLATISLFDLADSLIINADAVDAQSSAGGVAVLYHADADITNLAAARNTTGCYGGGVFVQGASLRLNNSKIFLNGLTNTTLCNASAGQSFGAGFFSGVDGGRGISVFGAVENNLFSKNTGLPIFDDDRQGPLYNDVRHNANQFYSTAYGSLVYKDSLTSAQDVPGLNNLVVSRSSAPATDKSPQGNNLLLSSAPTIAVLRAAPASVLPVTAVGDPTSVTTSYLGYAWSGTSATLNGASLPSETGVQAGSGAGSYTLQVGGSSASATVAQGPAPEATFKVTVTASYTQLDWNVTAGSFLDAAIDQGMSIPSTPSGSIQDGDTQPKVFSFYAITKEGGVVRRVDSDTPILNAPAQMTVVVGKNQADPRGYLPIWNEGGAQVNWTATDAAAYLTILNPSGSFQVSDTVVFSINPASLGVGSYQTTITVNGGSAGTTVTQLTVIVVQTLDDFLYLPFNSR
jgi:hypothetical protein